MGRRDNSPQASDLPNLVKVAKQAWRTQAEAHAAYLKAVEHALKAACRIVDTALVQGGYAKAEYRSGAGWQRAGFWTRHIPSGCEIFVEIIGRPDFMAGQDPEQVLRNWSRLISRHLQAPTFLISYQREGSPSGGPYLSIILQ